MFTHAKRGLKLLVYVDDVVAAAKTQDNIDWFYKKLSSRFNAKNLGEIHKILSVQINHDRKNHTIYLDQEQYICTILK